MLEIPLLLAVIILVALIFDFTNGAHDCANAIATVVSTKVMSPRNAVMMAAGLNLVGAMLGEEVAHTLGKGIVNTDMVMGCQALVLAALIGAIAWNLITWYYGIPSSSSHALIGGLMGAAVSHAGFASLNGWSIFNKILLPLVLSPLAGFAVSHWIACSGAISMPMRFAFAITFAASWLRRWMPSSESECTIAQLPGTRSTSAMFSWMPSKLSILKPHQSAHSAAHTPSAARRTASL